MVFASTWWLSVNGCHLWTFASPLVRDWRSTRFLKSVFKFVSTSFSLLSQKKRIFLPCAIFTWLLDQYEKSGSYCGWMLELSTLCTLKVTFEDFVVEINCKHYSQPNLCLTVTDEIINLCFQFDKKDGRLSRGLVENPWRSIALRQIESKCTGCILQSQSMRCRRKRPNINHCPVASMQSRSVDTHWIYRRGLDLYFILSHMEKWEWPSRKDDNLQWTKKGLHHRWSIYKAVPSEYVHKRRAPYESNRDHRFTLSFFLLESMHRK